MATGTTGAVRRSRTPPQGLNDADVQMILTSSPELWDVLERLARETGISTGELLTRAVALYKVAADALQNGERIALVSPSGQVERELIGILPRK
jgi:hypothetical protein